MEIKQLYENGRIRFLRLLSTPINLGYVLLFFGVKHIVKYVSRLKFNIEEIPMVLILRDKHYWLITWRTHIIFAVGVSIIVWLPFFVFCRIKRTAFSKNILLAATSVAGSLFLLEALLCIIPIGRTYWENQGNAYSSIFAPSKNRLYHHDTAITFNQRNSEFEYNYRTNQSGFVGKKWTLDKTTNKIRIVSSGDSFTEGVGAPMDSAYPVLLQQILGENYEVLNSGVSGSDPVFGYKTIEEIMLPYQPDIVLQTISENDIFFDIGVRGGLERFVGDSILKFKDPPIVETIYAVSYTSRLFIEALGLSPINMWFSDKYVGNKKVIEEKNKIIFDLLRHYEKLAHENHLKVYIVFLPMIHEMRKGEYRFDLTRIKNYIATLQCVKYIDLMPCYQSKTKENQDLIDQYYWKQDKHHNSVGYELMARCIADGLLNN